MNRIKCPGCGHRLKYAEEHAGKSAKCRKCGQSIQLPNSAHAPRPVNETMIFRCPWCSKAHRVLPNMVGQQIWCSKCQSPFIIPVTGAAASVPTPTAQINFPAQPPPVVSAAPPSLLNVEMDAGPPLYQQNPSNTNNGLIIGASVIGGVLLTVAIVVLIIARTGRVPSGPDPDSGGHGDWGSARRVANEKDGTTFLVGVKDAWWATDCPFSGNEKKRTLFVVYYYKNLGPREGSFFFVGPAVKTAKGHIFPRDPLRELSWPPATRAVGGWLPRQTTEIDATGEQGIVFDIPTSEVPVELIEAPDERTELIDHERLTFKLPQRAFEFRRYTQKFGFLPHPPEKAVPGLIDALQAQSDGIFWFRWDAIRELGRIGPGAKGAVPALINVLLHDEYTDVRQAAAETLGGIGPAAKEAIPALKNPLQASRPTFGGAAQNQLDSACSNAIQKIEGPKR
jgi:hypothetical protein